MKAMIQFLLAAKKATYAGKGPESLPSRPKSHDLEYVENGLKYIDSYFGGEKFVGEEALWENGTPFWAMNYCGRVVADGFEGDFLKDALSQVHEDTPYRGPAEYVRGSFSYTCTVKGDFEWFEGFEEIHLDGKKVYECMFHGGAIK